MKSADSEPGCDPARVEELFHAAADLSADEQDAFLIDACAGNHTLEAAVHALLTASRQPLPAWDAGAFELEARHSAAAAYHPRAGEFFGPYQIVRRIAAGGMGFVYEAERGDAAFHKRVAIKFVHVGVEDATASIERFRSERQILAELDHPNIARLLDGGATADGVPYLVMEYVDGVPIDQFVTERKLRRAERLSLFLQVCDAVQYAHRSLIVHRDLKPANILVTTDGVPKLLDFGIAKLLTGDGSLRTSTIAALTPAYASPEQVLGRSVGTAADVYSLGVLLFVLLAERLPYAVTEPGRDLARAICEGEPVWHPPGQIQGDLQSIIAMALRKEPERRYLSVEQLSGDVRRYLAGRPVIAGPDAFLYRARKYIVRHAIPLGAAAALVVAIAGGVVATLFQSRRAEQRFNDVRTLAHSVLFEVYDAISDLPGSVSARRLVISRAQQYLDSLATEAANDSALTRELAESYLRLGDVRGRPYTANLGDTTGALESYRKALALLERESARQPDDRRLQEQLTEAYMNVGVILMRQNDVEGSMSAAKRAIATAQLLADRNPHDVPYRVKLAHAYMRLGQAQDMVAQRSGEIADKQQVLTTYRHALEALQADGEHGEEAWKVRLATLYFYVGYPLRDLGDRTGEKRYYQEAFESALKGDAINRQLAASTESVARLRQLADGLVDLANARWRCCGDLDGSVRDLQEALGRFQAIVDRDASNLEARRDVANVHNARSRVLMEAGHRAEALEAAHRALTMYKQLAVADPTNAEDARCIAEVSARISALDRAQ